MAEIQNLAVDQVHIGSCTNSALSDMHKVADILRGRQVPSSVSLVIAPGSRQVLNMLAQDGSLADMIAAGARILEVGCGPCIGMGQSPRTNGVSLRTINRNFYGRSGTESAHVYLCSPEMAAVSALTGYLTDPTATAIEALPTVVPEAFLINDNMIVLPSETPEAVEIVRGPNIKPFPVNVALPEQLTGTSLIKVEDNITTLIL